MYPEVKPSLAFDIISTYNLTTLALADISFYPVNYDAVNPTYEITPPMFPPISVAFDQRSINIYNSNNLNITCTDSMATLGLLPDGIWRIRQTISPVSTFLNDKSFLRTNNLQVRFGEAFLKTDMINCGAEVGSEAMKYLNQIWGYIQGAIAASNQCNMVLAMDLYRLADRTLKNFMKDNCSAIPTRTSWY